MKKTYTHSGFITHIKEFIKNQSAITLKPPRWTKLLFFVSLISMMTLFMATSIDNKNKDIGKKGYVLSGVDGIDTHLLGEYSKSYFIDGSVKDIQPFIEASYQEFNNTFQLFSHGKPGELFIEGEWKNAEQIAKWLSTRSPIHPFTHLNIYGCEFAKGKKGKLAVEYLQATLGISIAASDDITGKNGDWQLEIGHGMEVLSLPNYPYDLQAGPFNFDFGTSASPVETGYTQVDETTTGGAYGWTDLTSLEPRDRAFGTDLNRDFIFSTETRTFETDVDNGTWEVTLTIGDAEFNTRDAQLSAEGAVEVNYTAAPAGDFQTYTFNTLVIDNKLSLEFAPTNPEPGQYWLINAVDLVFIAPLAPDAPVISVIDRDCSGGRQGEILVDADCAVGSTIEWSIDGGASWDTSIPIYSDLPSGTTVIARCVDDLDASISENSNTVEINPKFPPLASPTVSTPLCVGEDIAFTSTVTGGLLPLTYEWTGPNGFTSSIADPVISNATTAQTGVYTLTVTGSDGCVNVVEIGVIVKSECPPGDIPWIVEDGCTGLLSPGIIAATCGAVNSIPAANRWSFGMMDINAVTYADDRPVYLAPMYHHPTWRIDAIGNVYGMDNDAAGNVYLTASTHYGRGIGFNGETGVINYGSIGGGANDIGAAGTVYIIDGVTGEATVFAQLPQQASTFTHGSCEDNQSLTRTTGTGLGNTVYDPINYQLFVSNFEDGKIYRLDMNGNILNSFDPFMPDNGAAGFAPDKKPYGLAVSPDGSTLFFGTHNLDLNPELYSIDLDATGNFSGTEVFHTSLTGNGQIGGGFTTNGWVSISDLEFQPDGKLVVGIRTGCENNFATSHNHGGTFYIMDALGADGLFNDVHDNPRIHFQGDQLGPDDGYGGVSILDNGDGTWEYFLSSADIRQEEGPHGIMAFPSDYTTTGNNSTNYILEPAVAIPYIPTDQLNDLKGFGGDVLAFSECTTVSVGSTVFEDPDNNGTQDPGESGIAGVTIELYSAGSDGIFGTPDDVLEGIDITDSNGDYYFGDLLPGEYQLIIPGSEFGPGQELEQLTDSSTPTDTADNQEDGDDNGIQSGGQSTSVVSPVILLLGDQEPAGEAQQGGGQDASDDNNGDMTVDFGFVPCPPSVTASAISASCNPDGTSNDDANLQISASSDATHYDFNTGNTYTGGGFASATPFDPITDLPLQFGTTANPAAATDYTIRVFNGTDACFTDVIVTLLSINCCPTQNCFGISIQQN